MNYLSFLPCSAIASKKGTFWLVGLLFNDQFKNFNCSHPLWLSISEAEYNSKWKDYNFLVLDLVPVACVGLNQFQLVDDKK